jgi:hypothetical protein
MTEPLERRAAIGTASGLGIDGLVALRTLRHVGQTGDYRINASLFQLYPVIHFATKAQGCGGRRDRIGYPKIELYAKIELRLG